MVRKHIFVLFFVLLSAARLSAQLPDKVGGLISADRSAASISERNNPHAALSSIVDKQSIFFVPSSVNALNYLNNRPNLPDVLTWNPNFALVSRSLDWGVTSGPLEFQKVGAIKRYGQYVTVWRRDKRGNWRVHVRAEVENYGKHQPRAMVYHEPDDQWFLKHRSDVRLDQRKEVVMQTDNLFATVLKANTRKGYEEFLDENARLYFPWKGEVIGRKNIVSLLAKEKIEIDTESKDVGRAYSGEFAYTSGTATVGLKDKVLKFNYIRIWKLTGDYEWKVILEMMFER